MSFKSALKSGKFAVTAEVGPPKGTDIKEMLHHDEIKAAGKENALDAGKSIAARHIKQLKDEKTCDGVHIMAIGAEDKAPLIMERAGLL